jgi:looped-hinge helix DNA binding domain, AbrB family
MNGSDWYGRGVSTNVSHATTLGDRGRFVIPSDVRERHGWAPGTSLVAIDTDAGLILMSSDQALEWLRSRLEGRDLVGELLADRRREAEAGNS